MITNAPMAYIKINRNVKGSRLSFDPAARPPDDRQRIDALARFKIFDTPSEEIFSAYAELTALTFHAPIALISFVAEESVHYKEAFGVLRTGQLVPRKNSPCSIAIMSEEFSVFRYALTDPCVLADEKNLAEAGYKFYAGTPLKTKDGFNIGMLAVVNRAPKKYSEEDLEMLKYLATEVMHEVEYRVEPGKNTSIAILNSRLKAIHARVESLRG